MLKYTLTLLTLLLCLNVYGQRLTGIVVDAMGQPVPGALISVKQNRTISNNLGLFDLPAAKPGDTLRVFSMGFVSAVLPLTGIKDYLRVTLYVKSLPLKQVDIMGSRSYRQDSVRTRREFDRQFNYKHPTVADAFGGGYLPRGPGELIGVNPITLFKALTYKHSNAYKLQQHLLADECETFIDSKFNARIVTVAVPAHGDTLTNFLRYYRPALDFARKASVYDMLMYVKKSYAQFAAKGFKADTAGKRIFNSSIPMAELADFK